METIGSNRPKTNYRLLFEPGDQSGGKPSLVVGIRSGYTYARHYKDLPYQLVVPANIMKTTYRFGEGNFYLQLNSPEGDTPVASIVMYYDFNGQLRNAYFGNEKKVSEKPDIVRVNNRDIYRSVNWQGEFSGKIFLSAS